MATLLALFAALFYAGGDFLGGFASRRSHSLSVVLWSQLTGTVILIGCAPFVARQGAVPSALGWGAIAGLFGTAGLILLYEGLAKGRMGVVSPTTAVAGSVVPVLFALATGERPSPVALGGMAIGLGAIAVLGAASTSDTQTRPTSAEPVSWLPVLLALGAGVGFAGFFIAISRAPDDAGLMPLLGARMATVPLVLVLAARARALVLPQSARLPAMSTGLLDMGANVAYLFAVRRGDLATAAVVTSLYPAGTVLLARVVLAELITRAQLGGLILGGVAVGLVALA